MEVDKDNLKAPGSSEGLRTKRKYGRKGTAPTMKISMLSEPDSQGFGASVFDITYDNEENIDQILQMRKTKTKSRNKGLKERDRSSVSKGNAKKSKSSSKSSSTRNKEAAKDKPRKKRKSMSFTKDPDEPSDSNEDEDDISEASRKAPHKKKRGTSSEWVESRNPEMSQLARVMVSSSEPRGRGHKKTPQPAKSTNKRRTPAPSKHQGTGGYDSDTGSVMSAGSATMRLSTFSASASVGRENEGIGINMDSEEEHVAPPRPARPGLRLVPAARAHESTVPARALQCLGTTGHRCDG